MALEGAVRVVSGSSSGAGGGTVVEDNSPMGVSPIAPGCSVLTSREDVPWEGWREAELWGRAEGTLILRQGQRHGREKRWG